MAHDFRYPARVEPNGTGGWIASFIDVPEARTEAFNLGELKESALDALVTAIDFYEGDGRAFPLPSTPVDGDLVVKLPAADVSRGLRLHKSAGA